MIETPISFSAKKTEDGHELEYDQLMEICQGGPETGELSVDGVKIENWRFGGPAFIHKGTIYVPALQRKFVNSGFILAQINISTKQVRTIGKMRPLIYIDGIDGENLCYFEDINRTKRSSISIK